MNFRNYRLSKCHLFRIASTLITPFLILLIILLGASCSKEKPQEVQKANMVRQNIKSVQPEALAPLQKEKTIKKDEKEQVSDQFSSEEQSIIETQPLIEKEPPQSKKFEPQLEITKKEGVYTVRQGDSLALIAGRNDVYNNHMKWTSLFRHNMDKFDGMKTTRNFPDKELPEGISLIFVTSSEAEQNSTKYGKKIYSVNVLSSDSFTKIAPGAIMLMQHEFNAYITTATLDNKEWVRLRVGFYNSYADAAEAGKHITSIMDGSNVWVARIGKNETKDYCGY